MQIFKGRSAAQVVFVSGFSVLERLSRCKSFFDCLLAILMPRAHAFSQTSFHHPLLQSFTDESFLPNSSLPAHPSFAPSV